MYTERLRWRLSSILKLLFAAALLIWMSRSGRLNLTQVAGAFAHWPELLGMAALLYAQLALTAWRWGTLLEAQGLTLPFRRIFALNMIGLLFNFAIPGAVGGDVMKAYYIGREAQTQRAEAVGTILLDRVTGLLGLLWLVAGAACWYFDVLAAHRLLGLFAGLAVAAAAGGASVLAALVVFGARLSGPVRYPRAQAVLRRLLLGLEAYSRRPRVLPWAVLASMAGHLLACGALYLAIRTLGWAAPPAALLLLAVPLGFLTLSVPVAPAGIGVGQAAFFSLFEMVAPGHATLGANALTVLQSVLLLVYLTGLYPYLTYRRLGRPLAQPAGNVQ